MNYFFVISPVFGKRRAHAAETDRRKPQSLVPKEIHSLDGWDFMHFLRAGLVT